MKRFLKICLIVFVCLVIIGWVWATLTWFNVIPNWFWNEFICSNNYDIEDYDYSKVGESVEWYDYLNLKSRFIWKYWEVPKSWRNPNGDYCPMYSCRPGEYCPSVRLDSVECKAWPYYEMWLEDTFTSDEIEKINKYKSCFKSCGYYWYKNYDAKCDNH